MLILWPHSYIAQQHVKWKGKKSTTLVVVEKKSKTFLVGCCGWWGNTFADDGSRIFLAVLDECSPLSNWLVVVRNPPHYVGIGCYANRKKKSRRGRQHRNTRAAQYRRVSKFWKKWFFAHTKLWHAADINDSNTLDPPNFSLAPILKFCTKLNAIFQFLAGLRRKSHIDN